jgi:hypothetical protein
MIPSILAEVFSSCQTEVTAHKKLGPVFEHFTGRVYPSLQALRIILAPRRQGSQVRNYYIPLRQLRAFDIAGHALREIFRFLVAALPRLAHRG